MAATVASAAVRPTAAPMAMSHAPPWPPRAAAAAANAAARPPQLSWPLQQRAGRRAVGVAARAVTTRLPPGSLADVSTDMRRLTEEADMAEVELRDVRVSGVCATGCSHPVAILNTAIGCGRSRPALA
eukprot:3697-Chlamydomonas_euryale.AAC.1